MMIINAREIVIRNSVSKWVYMVNQNSKEGEESLLKWTIQRNRRKQLERSSKDLFKKIGDTKGTLHANTGTTKDRNGKDLTEAEKIKKRWQEYRKELCKNGLNDPNNHDGVITHLEPGILKYEVKWALGSITTKQS